MGKCFERYKYFFCFILDKPDPPKFVPTFEKVELKRGQQFSVICLVASVDALGIPNGTLKWFVENINTANVLITSDELFSIVSIKSVMKENNGTYTCRTENPIGNREIELQLVVSGEVS